MTPLSGLDALFLHLETPATPMHVGALHLLAAPQGESRAYVAAVRRHLAARLHLSPVFTRRLAPMPFAIADPVWVHADTLDLRAHVRHVRLPAPGTDTQLRATVARLHARPLERDRPLWRLHVIEGLASGELALYTKIHHATLDGAASVAFATALLDTTPVPRAVPPGEHPAQGAHPGPGRLLGTAVRTTAVQAMRAFRQLPELARVTTALVARSGAVPAHGVRGASFRFAPRTLTQHLDRTRSRGRDPVDPAVRRRTRRRPSPGDRQRRGTRGGERRAAAPSRRPGRPAGGTDDRGGAGLAAQGR